MTTDEFQIEALRLRPALVAFARQYLGDGAEAEDVVQDALLKMWSMCEELHMPIAALAKVLVRNMAVDHLRRRRIKTPVEQLQVADDEDDAQEGVERMMNIVESLPGMQQTIIRLRHMECMDMGEIARAIGSNEVAVRKALSRARKAVRDEYFKRYKL